MFRGSRDGVGWGGCGCAGCPAPAVLLSPQASICRSSQPLSGFSARCLEDEQMLQAIRKANPGSDFIYVVDTRPKVSVTTLTTHIFAALDQELGSEGKPSDQGTAPSAQGAPPTEGCFPCQRVGASQGLSSRRARHERGLAIFPLLLAVCWGQSAHDKSMA